jgi:hypothetical protein
MAQFCLRRKWLKLYNNKELKTYFHCTQHLGMMTSFAIEKNIIILFLKYNENDSAF